MSDKKMNLGELIEACKSWELYSVEPKGLSGFDSSPIKVDNFIFSSSRHSTGITVHVGIQHPETSKIYMIVNGTYWFCESSYGFNKFTWEKGKWDNALNGTIAQMREAVSAANDKDETEQKALQDKHDASEQAKKEHFEAIF